jgi:prepilin-type N-terminal cleavage/methylation domain-containing protein
MSMARPHANGFTLLEMLVVILLMSSTAVMAFALLGNQQQQVRYDDTLRRLDALRAGIVGETGAIWSGEARLSGFVADNGRLPDSLRELTATDLADATECVSGGVTNAAKLHCFKARLPVFDPTPDSTSGLDNGSGDEINLSGDAEKLLKGQRRLLEARAGGAAYRDGWGNTGSGDDADNFGWGVTFPATAVDPLKIKSLGANNAVDASPPSPDTEFVSDIEKSILADDWSQDIVGWSVRLTNLSGSAQPASGYLAVSLLVYENALGGGKWRRYTSNFNGSLADGDSVDLVFPGGGYPGGSLSTRIPQGEHLLLLVHSDDTTAHDADDAPYAPSGSRITTPARFHARAARPVRELTLR